MHACMHACIHTYIHTYIHAYIAYSLISDSVNMGSSWSVLLWYLSFACRHMADRRLRLWAGRGASDRVSGHARSRVMGRGSGSAARRPATLLSGTVLLVLWDGDRTQRPLRVSNPVQPALLTAIFMAFGLSASATSWLVW